MTSTAQWWVGRITHANVAASAAGCRKWDRHGTTQVLVFSGKPSRLAVGFRYPRVPCKVHVGCRQCIQPAQATTMAPRPAHTLQWMARASLPTGSAALGPRVALGPSLIGAIGDPLVLGFASSYASSTWPQLSCVSPQIRIESTHFSSVPSFKNKASSEGETCPYLPLSVLQVAEGRDESGGPRERPACNM